MGYWLERDTDEGREAEMDRRLAAFRAAKRRLLPERWRSMANGGGEDGRLGERADDCEPDELEREAEAILARMAAAGKSGEGTTSTNTNTNGEGGAVIATASKHEHETRADAADAGDDRPVRHCPSHGEHRSRTGCVKCKAEKVAARRAGGDHDTWERAKAEARRKWTPETSNRLARLAASEADDPAPPVVRPAAGRVGPRLAAMVTTIGGSDEGEPARPVALPPSAPPVAPTTVTIAPPVAAPAPEPTVTPTPRPWRSELDAMAAVGAALDGLAGDPAAIRRVLGWARATFGGGGEGDITGRAEGR